MTIVKCVSVGALFLLSFAAVAQSSPSANGDFQFAIEGATGSIQFDARMKQGGPSLGQMLFTAEGEISNADPDGTEAAGGSLSNLTIGVTFDCLAVRENVAVMSGVIDSSSVADYIGQRALLAVKDNGEGVNAPELDAFTWGVYRSTARTWIPSDAEVPDDNGWMLSWLATDAERPDDVGVPSNHGSVINCETFPLGAYALVSIPHGGGNVQVRP